jgi:hypothetical protein
MTKSQQIRDYKEANPKLKAKEIAKACGVTTTYVYQVLHNAKNKTKKLIATTLGIDDPTKGQKVVRDEMNRLHAEMANLQILDEVNEAIIKDYQNEIEQLKNDIVGYRAVISYLQGQLDGVTV